MTNSDEIISVKNVFKIFGAEPETAMKMLDAGASKKEVFENRPSHRCFRRQFCRQAWRNLCDHGALGVWQVDDGALVQPPYRTDLRQHLSKRSRNYRIG